PSLMARFALPLNAGMREVTSTRRFGAARRHRLPPRAPEVHVASARCRKPLPPALENSLVLVEKRHETSSISASGRRRCRPAGAAPLRARPPLAWAPHYPTRPVRIVAPYPAGIAPDIVARVVAQALSQRLKQQFIVDNRPGGASNVGTAMVVHAAPDGYTLLVVTTTNAINASLYDNLDFDLMRDIAPVAGLVRLGLVIVVHPSVPAPTLGEFIAYAKANPGKINYASVGSGAATNVAGELFKAMAGVDLVNVPYRGSYLPDLISGQVQASFTPILQSLGYIKAGK